MGQQSTCGPLEPLIRGLARNYGEAPIARGATGTGLMVIVFSTRRAGGSFTIVTVKQSPAGPIACIQADGDGWETIPWNQPEISG